MTKIGLVHTSNRAEGVNRAIKLLQYNPVQGKSVVLKPNFNSADPTPGSTHIDTLRALILNLKKMGASKITVAERSGPGPTTRENLEKKGVLDLAKEIGFEIANLEEMSPEGWVKVVPKSSHWKDGFLFPQDLYRSRVHRPDLLPQDPPVWGAFYAFIKTGGRHGTGRIAESGRLSVYE